MWCAMLYLEPDIYVRVASFDVGLKNTCMCILDFQGKSFTIRKWENVTISGKNIANYTSDLISKLKTHQYGCLDYVLIEQQINRNTQMKVLSHVIQTFFICDIKLPNDRVIFVSPKKRLEQSCPIHARVIDNVRYELGMDTTRLMSRRDYKNFSIAIAEKYLLNEKHLFWNNFFNLLSKKDDFADSLVQAIAWNSSSSIDDID